MIPDVLVAGGGISGLSAAYELTRRGVTCLLVEKADRLGGLISTIEQDGFLMDAGPDAFLAAKPHARELCEELGLSSELIPTNPTERKVFVLRGGKLHPMPEGMRLTIPTRALPLLASDLFSFGGKLRMLAEPFVAARRDDSEESIASFVERRFGREALERVGEPLLAGIHCGAADRLSMTRLFPRIVELERLHGSVTRGMLRVASSEGPVFLSLAGGMGRLVNRLREKLPPRAVRLDAQVTGLRERLNGFEVELGTGESIGCRALVLALPLPATVGLLAGLAPSASRELARIPMVSTAVVFHGFRRANVGHPLDGYGFVVPAGEPNRLLAVTFVTTKFPNRARDGDVLFRAFHGGTKDPDAMQLDDRSLADLSRRELVRALGPLGEPTHSRVIRWERRTPQVELGHHVIVSAADEALARKPGLYVLANGLGGVGIPDSVANARACATRIADYLQT